MDANLLLDLPNVETVLYAVGYDRTADVPIERLYTEGLSNVLRGLPEADRFLYISSTGVYGQADASLVDEDSPCEPTRNGGRACLQAEKILGSSRFGDRTVILRMAGIYGPGRIPRRRELVAGRPLAAPQEGLLNLIHVDDAARAVLVAEQSSPTPALYCLADGQPPIRRDYYRYLARLLEAKPPRFTAPAEGSPAASRAGSNKRVSSRRFLESFAFQLQYPTYQEGLAAIIRAEAGEPTGQPDAPADGSRP
jgi:nucleoside-diphosphate-sugar epimerase